ncbi:MAG: DUF2220 family protein [Desulfosporosinus sp.]|nr:DUF2220 family protein [Desulfosporosinus sp.]
MKKLILSKLLTKYEGSKHARGEEQIQRRVSLKTQDYPEYQKQDLGLHKSFHQAVLELAAQGLVEIEWVQFERGNLIKTVHLVLAKVEESYLMAERKPKLDVLGELEDQLVNLHLLSPWSKDFMSDCLEELWNKLRYPSQLPTEPDKLKLLLDTLVGLEAKGSEEMLERIFSKRYLGNSKLFERHVRHRLTGILHRYHKDSDLEEEALLAEVGLVRATSEVLIAGPVQLYLKGKTLDISPFCYGLGLGNETLSEAEVAPGRWLRIISVENKATFREFLRKGIDEYTLLICLGGFAGPIKRKFLAKLYQTREESVQYYHWGDLDYGGLQIFNHLRTCWPSLQPMLMDLETYQSFLEFGEPFEDDYGGKLQRLLGREEFVCFHELISAMLKQKETLEQEAVPIPFGV